MSSVDIVLNNKNYVQNNEVQDLQIRTHNRSDTFHLNMLVVERVNGFRIKTQHQRNQKPTVVTITLAMTLRLPSD